MRCGCSAIPEIVGPFGSGSDCFSDDSRRRDGLRSKSGSSGYQRGFQGIERSVSGESLRRIGEFSNKSLSLENFPCDMIFFKAALPSWTTGAGRGRRVKVPPLWSAMALLIASVISRSGIRRRPLWYEARRSRNIRSPSRAASTPRFATDNKVGWQPYPGGGICFSASWYRSSSFIWPYATNRFLAMFPL